MAAGTRERMVFSAMQLFRRHGYNGTGFREVVAHSRTPRGSIYHHFPEGKAELGVDALDLAYGKTHIDSFALVSGDSDFSPLVSKLRENDRYVIGLGVKSSSSDLLVANCDEFIFYEDLIRDTKKTTLLRGMPEKKAEAMAQLIDAIQALQRENKETLWRSMVKQTMIRKNPAFNETYYGFPTFSKLLEDAAKQKIVTLERDEKSGTYVITALSEEGGRAA